MNTGEDVFQFSDFRAFLKAHYQDMKRTQPKFTLGVWARRLNLSATASLSMILNGQRMPGPRLTKSLVAYFKFADEKKKTYFTDLIQLQKIKRFPDLSVLMMEKLGRSHPQGSFRLLNDEEFCAISKWHHYAIVEMTRLQDFREDAEWIKGRLRISLTKREIEGTLTRLLKLGLLVRNGTGKLEPTNAQFNTNQDVANEGLKRFHEEMIAHAREAIREVDVLDREITATTLSIKKECLPLAKQRIRKFLEEMIELLESNSADTTYQLNVQMFPLTVTKKNRREN